MGRDGPQPSGIPRSRQGHHRRQSILDAAETLIRENRSTDFTMLALARRSGVSPATPYNLFGTKASILYALLTRSLDSIFTDFGTLTAKMDPFKVVQFAGQAAVAFFVADPSYYRPLYLYLIGVPDEVYRPPYMNRALNYWRDALQPLCDTGYIKSDHMRDTLARSLIIHFIGSLDMWAQCELDHDEFMIHIRYGVASLLCVLASDAARAPVLDEALASLSESPRPIEFRASLKSDRSSD